MFHRDIYGRNLAHHVLIKTTLVTGFLKKHYSMENSYSSLDTFI